jgi:hypothetical protein
MTRIAAGRDTIEAVIALAGRVLTAIGLEDVGVGWAAVALAVLLAAAGGAVGWAAWRLAGRVAARVGEAR